MKTIKLWIEIDSPNLARELFIIHTQVRQGNLPLMDSNEVHLRTLENMITEFHLLGDIDSQLLVASNYHHLNVLARAPEAINRL